ncbi:unnamed protein product, partial [Effrenium voratum]
EDNTEPQLGTGKHARKRASVTRGISSLLSNGGLMYAVTVFVHWFRFQICCVKSLEDAVEKHVMLISIVERIRKNSSGPLKDSAQSADGGHPEEPKIWLEMNIPACHWIGRELRTPSFRMKDLELLDEPLWQLRAARGIFKPGRLSFRGSLMHLEQMWLQIRQAYLDLLVALGKDIAPAAARLDLLFSKHEPHREKIWRRWNLRMMRRSEEEQTRRAKAKRK